MKTPDFEIVPGNFVWLLVPSPCSGLKVVQDKVLSVTGESVETQRYDVSWAECFSSEDEANEALQVGIKVTGLYKTWLKIPQDKRAFSKSVDFIRSELGIEERIARSIATEMQNLNLIDKDEVVPEQSLKHTENLF